MRIKRNTANAVTSPSQRPQSACGIKIHSKIIFYLHVTSKWHWHHLLFVLLNEEFIQLFISLIKNGGEFETNLSLTWPSKSTSRSKFDFLQLLYLTKIRFREVVEIRYFWDHHIFKNANNFIITLLSMFLFSCTIQSDSVHTE